MLLDRRRLYYIRKLKMWRFSYDVVCLFILLHCLCNFRSSAAGKNDVVIELHRTNYTVDESNSAEQVCLNASGRLAGSTGLELLFSVSKGTALEGSDFILNRNHTLHPDSNTGNVFCLLVFQVCEDSVPENNETFTLTMTTTTSHVRLMHSNLTVNIIDNDEILMIFNENSYTVAEGSVVEVCVEPAGYNERSDIQLSLYPTTGSAKTLDYFISGNRLEHWNFKGNIFQKCITLSAVDDVLPEASEFITIRVSTNDSLVTLDRESVRVYITDNDPVLFMLPEKVHTVVEGDDTEVCLLLENHDLPRIRFQLTIFLLTSNATSEDYTVLNEVDYTAGGNEAESDQICSQVHTIDDQVTEGVEVLNIALQLSTGVSWVTLGDLDNPNWHTAKIVIQDNDVVTVQFTSSSYSVLEGRPYVSFCINVDGVLSPFIRLTVAVTSISQSALGRVDYEESAFEFSLHNSNICHQVRIVDDEEPESEEEFHVCVSSPNPLVVITTRCAAIHIIDNDTPELRWGESHYVVSESAGSVEVCVEVVGTLSRDVEVELSTEDHSAVGFYDYSPERYVFSFGPSSEQRQCRHIEILADELLEKQEVFKASLQLLQDNLLNLPQMDVLVTIEDNLNTSGIVHDAVCVDGDVELIRGARGDGYSLVEMCGGGRWQSVCDSDWTAEDTALVCLEAGHARNAKGQRSLPSLATAAVVFRCTATESSLQQCLEPSPDNITCQHLEVICTGRDAVTVSPTASSSNPTTSSTNTSENREPNSSHESSFSVAGAVVGIISALVLVGVVLAVGVAMGALVWRRRTRAAKAESDLADYQSHQLESPVYGVLESPVYGVLENPVYGVLGNPASSSASTTHMSSDSSHDYSDIYSELLPPATPNAATTGVPSFYDVIRPVPEFVESDEQEEGEGEGGEGEGEEGDQGEAENQATLHEKIPPCAQTTVPPVPSLDPDEEEQYSTLEHTRHYATLELYTGSSSAPETAKEQENEEEEEQYAHLQY